MNILFVNDIPFNPIGGGIERVTDVLTRELIKRGYTIYYICGKLPETELYMLNYEYPATLYQLPNYGMFANKENLAFYKQLQKELKIDIVVNQKGLDGGLNAILPATCTKLISVIHSRPDAYIVMHLNQLLKTAAPPFASFKKVIKKILPFTFLAYWKRKHLKETAYRYNVLLNTSDVIVTLSHDDIKIFNRIIGHPHNKKILSIPNPNTFSKTSNKDIYKEKTILYVGRLEMNEKAPHRLLKVWERLHQVYSDWKLIIVGDGSEKQRMIDYVKTKQLTNVLFEGQQANVRKYYEMASFICLTSNIEGWGMVLTEGMQYGCIPFTFNNYGGAYEIIDDGINGCLIPAYDLKKYASRLSSLMSDKDKRSKMSIEAIEKVKTFSVENIVDKWEEIFNNLKNQH